MTSLSDRHTGIVGGVVFSVNVSGVRIVEHRGRVVEAGIFKTPVEGQRPFCEETKAETSSAMASAWSS